MFFCVGQREARQNNLLDHHLVHRRQRASEGLYGGVDVAKVAVELAHGREHVADVRGAGVAELDGR